MFIFKFDLFFTMFVLNFTYFLTFVFNVLKFLHNSQAEFFFIKPKDFGKLSHIASRSPIKFLATNQFINEKIN